MKLEDNLNDIEIDSHDIFFKRANGRYLHNRNGPSQISSGGNKSYHVNGHLSNLLGKYVIIFADGSKTALE